MASSRIISLLVVACVASGAFASPVLTVKGRSILSRANAGSGCLFHGGGSRCFVKTKTHTNPYGAHASGSATGSTYNSFAHASGSGTAYGPHASAGSFNHVSGGHHFAKGISHSFSKNGRRILGNTADSGVACHAPWCKVVAVTKAQPHASLSVGVAKGGDSTGNFGLSKNVAKGGDNTSTYTKGKVHVGHNVVVATGSSIVHGSHGH